MSFLLSVESLTFVVWEVCSVDLDLDVELDEHADKVSIAVPSKVNVSKYFFHKVDFSLKN